MREFLLCDRCQAEYEDPRDRRFHAQPNACPDCGPRVEFWDRAGQARSSAHDAIRDTVHALREGAIAAVKGLGGFHLMVAAGDTVAVERLRRRKGREEKPLAVMFPSPTLAGAVCEIAPMEERLLRSPEAPIVLLRRRGDSPARKRKAEVAASVAPGNPTLGVMLPYTPLHHLLLRAFGAPVVATSGNLSDEPICIDEREALSRLGGIADVFLVHNRRIVRHVDDSIVRVVLDREMVLRRARGFAPLPVMLEQTVLPTLAVGAHVKNTVAVAKGRQVFLSQHIGDLETAPALAAFDRVVNDLTQLYEVKPEVIAADAHPDYLSSKRARGMGKRVVCVQHHYAHILACMAENTLAAPLLGVCWDGTGYGPDETVWGGEFLLVTESEFERVAHLRAFRLPGGERAVREPRRTAVGLLFAMLGEAVFTRRDLHATRAFTPGQLQAIRRMLHQRINSPSTSSAGRLFDAVASITGLRHEVGFEGQAAMDLEFALEQDDSDEVYPVRLADTAPAPSWNGELIEVCPRHRECEAFRRMPPRWIVDWAPMIERVLKDLYLGVPVWEISAKFHNTLAEYIVHVARRVGEVRVALTGGCFQNRYLLERAIQRLRSEGFTPYWHQRVPPNDGGVALGQVVAANRRQDNQSS
jgi:hydrogenase maturation protein HypF